MSQTVLYTWKKKKKNLQPYLLDFTLYTLAVSQVTLGREFQVATPARCAGLRCNAPGALTAVAMRLYRTDTGAQVAAKTGLSLAEGENILAFATPADLDPTLTYRIALSHASLSVSQRAADDHPDGNLTILTDNCECYQTTDAYPDLTISRKSLALEPTIYA